MRRGAWTGMLVAFGLVVPASAPGAGPAPPPKHHAGAIEQPPGSGVTVSRASERALIRGIQSSGPDAVTYWNDVLLKIVRQLRPMQSYPGPVSRGAAMMHGAIYDAVNSIAPSGYRPYLVSVPSAPGASIEAAIAHAAHDALAAAFPRTTVDLEAERDNAIDALPAGADIAGGEAVGKAAARAMIDARRGDRAGYMLPYVSGTEPGDWRPTGSGPAATPNWPSVKPFVIPAGDAFRPPLPGGYSSKRQMLASSEYAEQFNTVKKLGKSNSTLRTREQTQIAFFWANDIDGTYKPPGHLLDIAKTLADQESLGLVEKARLFALAALAMADAMIVAWDAKYATDVDLWRPETAIREAASDGNPATKPNRRWKPLSFDPTIGEHFSPPFPAYVSGHATLGAAHFGVMRRFFGTDNVRFTATTEDPNLPPGVTRTFESFTEAALEEARSRVYLGVHFPWDAAYGNRAGSAVARYVYNHALTRIGA